MSPTAKSAVSMTLPEATSKGDLLQMSLEGQTIEELERTKLEKQRFLGRLEKVMIISIPNRLHQIDEEMEKLRLEKEKNETLADKSNRAIAGVKSFLDQCNKEIQRLQAAAADDAVVDLTMDELEEMDCFASFGNLESTIYPNVARMNKSKEPQSQGPSAVSFLPPPKAPLSSSMSSIPKIYNQAAELSSSSLTKSSSSTTKNGWHVLQLEDARVTKLVQNRWQIMKSNQPLRFVLEGYHSERCARNFDIAFDDGNPVESRVLGNSARCVLCNRPFEDNQHVSIQEWCSTCIYHPTCAAVHLDYVATKGVDYRVCVGKVFNKCKQQNLTSPALDEESESLFTDPGSKAMLSVKRVKMSDGEAI